MFMPVCMCLSLCVFTLLLLELSQIKLLNLVIKTLFPALSMPSQF